MLSSSSTFYERTSDFLAKYFELCTFLLLSPSALNIKIILLFCWKVKQINNSHTSWFLPLIFRLCIDIWNALSFFRMACKWTPWHFCSSLRVFSIVLLKCVDKSEDFLWVHTDCNIVYAHMAEYLMIINDKCRSKWCTCIDRCKNINKINYLARSNWQSLKD